MGSWSFVFGALISLTSNVVCAWLLVRPGIRLNFDALKSYSLWSDTWTLTATAIVTTTVQQIDYIMLGIFQKNWVGYYYFAFTIATQASQILGSNLSTVFLPALCRVQADSKRQLGASLYAFKLIAGIGIPFAFIQAALVDCSFRIFLPVKWLAAIPFAQVLSFGLGVNILCSLCWSLLKAQGRFREILLLNAIGGACFCTSVGLTAAFGYPIMVAWCVVVFCVLYAPIVLWMSIAKIGGKPSDVVSIFGIPAVASSLSYGIATILDVMVPASKNQDIYRFAVTALSFCGVYAFIVVFARHPIVEYISQLTRRIFRLKVS